MKVIETRSLGFAFSNSWLFRDLTLSVEAGEFAAIVGPNGSGKSTLLHLLTRGLVPTEGEISLFGTPIGRFASWDRVGYVSQSSDRQQKSFPVTAKEVVSMGLLAGRKGFSFGDRPHEAACVRRILEVVGMWDFRDQLIGSLSGGQRQRVFLARALVGEASLLFLDEPTSGIDADAKRDIYSLLRQLNKEKGITIVMVSHDMELAAEVADKALCLEVGGVCYWGQASQIMQHRHKGGYYYAGGGINNDGAV